jgi:hypothetical protein
MTDGVREAVIGAAALVGVALVQGYTAKRVAQVQAKLNEVHSQINSRMDQLLELTKSSSKAEGIKEEKEKAKEEPKT